MEEKDNKNLQSNDYTNCQTQDSKDMILKAKIEVVRKHIKLALSTIWLSIEIVLFFAGLLFYVSPSDFINIHPQLLDERVITMIVGLTLFMVSFVRFTVLHFRFVHIPKYDLYKTLYCLIFSIIAIFISHILAIVFGWVVVTLMITIFGLYSFNKDYEDHQKLILGKSGNSKEFIIDRRSSEKSDGLLSDPEERK